mgnify:CR=1 FL=1
MSDDMDTIKGIREIFQDLLAPDLRAIKNELKNHTERLIYQAQQLEEIRKGVTSIEKSLAEIKVMVDLERRVSALEAKVRS